MEQERRRTATGLAEKEPRTVTPQPELGELVVSVVSGIFPGLEGIPLGGVEQFLFFVGPSSIFTRHWRWREIKF